MREGFCKAGVLDGMTLNSHQCMRKAKVDGFCKQHHPDAVEERRIETMARYKAKWANDPLPKAWGKLNKIKELVKEYPKDALAMRVREIINDN